MLTPFFLSSNEQTPLGDLPGSLKIKLGNEQNFFSWKQSYCMWVIKGTTIALLMTQRGTQESMEGKYQ